MTELPPDPQPVTVSGGDMLLQPGRRLLITGRSREPRPRGLGLVILAIIVAMLCAYAAILLKRSYDGQRQREQLACQVQRLGGEPIGGVDCPKRPAPAPAPARTVRASPAATAPLPAGPSVVIVMPPGSTGTRVGPSPTPTGRAPSSRPRASTGASPRASSSPRATPSPTPVIRVCLPSVPCFPSIHRPATKEHPWLPSLR